jgi:GntR family transcriptional repressor for pyruvate dehydrogenase complex
VPDPLPVPAPRAAAPPVPAARAAAPAIPAARAAAPAVPAARPAAPAIPAARPATPAIPGARAAAPAVPGARPPKTAEVIAGRLRGRIVRGELSAGSRLPPEAELQQQLGVSRPTLREAFRILEAESLLSVRRGARGGAQIVTPDRSVAARHIGSLLQVSGATIGEVYEARLAIEPTAARLLALRGGPDAVRTLRTHLILLRAVVAGGPSDEEWSRASSRFHDLIVELCGNKALAISAGVLREIATTHAAVAVTRPETPATMARAVRSYTRLAGFVEAADGYGAERHWRAHLQAAGATLGAEALDLYGEPNLTGQ